MAFMSSMAFLDVSGATPRLRLLIMINSLSRGVAPDTSKKAIEDMKAKGILVLDELDMAKIKKF